MNQPAFWRGSSVGTNPKKVEPEHLELGKVELIRTRTLPFYQKSNSFELELHKSRTEPERVRVCMYLVLGRIRTSRTWQSRTRSNSNFTILPKVELVRTRTSQKSNRTRTGSSLYLVLGRIRTFRTWQSRTRSNLNFTILPKVELVRTRTSEKSNRTRTGSSSFQH